jgi:hypothetical protein
MDSKGNPELAEILRILKNPSEAVIEQSTIASLTGPALDNSIIPATQSSAQVGKAPTITDPRRRPAAPSVDPSRITTWPVAQKYVIDNIYSHQTLASKIKQLIQNQHSQERQWWAEREALVSKHQGRVEKEKQIAALLQSMGGIAAPTKASNSGEEEAELRRCDLKIHKAMTKLATDIDRELRSIGVPFYAIKHELVILEEGHTDRALSGRLDKGELRELQKRMLQLLEELFKE